MSGINIGGDVSGQVVSGDAVFLTQQQGVPKETTKQITILFWASNPIDTDPLRLDEEVRTIDERLRLADQPGRFDLRQQWALRITDLSDGLLRYRPDIVHFSGHGNPSGGIALEAGDGTSKSVPVAALAGLFDALADSGKLRCVVFNACYSEEQAQAVAEHVDCVIGTSTAIGDEAAISFAAGFYRALGYGETVKTAFGLGCNEIALEGQEEERTPKLHTRPGIDAGEVRFFSRDA